ncbi:MAG: bifunctional oligoribonuclease/PAP phosphatase NrnA [Deltaproteobacteria bacterium]|nr:bifunctional oligoribonuclease/PAP phosphatase NrnA [Deltaproteobacteria bacterium]
MRKTRQTLKKIIDVIRSRRRFLITSHVRLDGDAIGSELALYLILRDMGKEASVYNRDATPQMYRFLPGSDQIMNSMDTGEIFDAVFILDCSDIDRVGEEAPRVGAIRNIINIDHHISNGSFGDLSLLDPAASSTGELVYRLMRELGVNITKDVAINLYTAILTDTGAFRYSNTDRRTLRVASELVAKGADPWWISQKVYENHPAQKMKLLAKALDTMAFFWDRKIAVIHVTKKMLEEAGALWEYTEGFVEFPRSIEGVEVAAFISEIGDRFFKVSLRSRGNIDVESIAGAFGGGGHHNAAACRITGDLEGVRKQLVEAVISNAAERSRRD